MVGLIQKSDGSTGIRLMHWRPEYFSLADVVFMPYLSGLLLEKANNLSIFLDLGGHDTQCLQQEEIEGKHHSPLHVLVLEASHQPHLIEEEKVK